MCVEWSLTIDSMLFVNKWFIIYLTTELNLKIKKLEYSFCERKEEIVEYDYNRTYLYWSIWRVLKRVKILKKFRSKLSKINQII